MVIHVNLENNAEKKDNSKIHLLPCLIKSNDEANVKKYFETSIRSQDNVLSASFRGYPLLGREISLPKNYSGVVLHEAQEKLNEDCERNLYVSHTFNKLTYWNWDKMPSDDDRLISALQWINIAKAIHSPIDSAQRQ